jgi:hypothetical protein
MDLLCGNAMYSCWKLKLCRETETCKNILRKAEDAAVYRCHVKMSYKKNGMT